MTTLKTSSPANGDNMLAVNEPWEERLTDSTEAKTTTKKRRRRELITFAVLAFGIWPIVAVGVVGGYGFLVWMFQTIFGPPGPPAH